MTDDCRPPPEHDAEPWHWVLMPEHPTPKPLRWWSQGRYWTTAAGGFFGPSMACPAPRASDLGWRWIAVARAPAPDPLPAA